MFDKVQALLGTVGGLDIAAIVASIGYVARCTAEIVQWIRERRGQRIDQIFIDAIQWVYLNGVQRQKKEANGNGLTLEQGKAALESASAKAVALA
jgi:hypothetical protein